MPRGGARVGAGRKPKKASVLPPVTAGFTPTVVDGGRAVHESYAESIGVIPPADLPPEHRDFWHRYANVAIAQGTLTLDTVAGFRLLCELDAEKAAVKQTIDRDGRTYIKVTVDGSGQEHQELKSHPLYPQSRDLCKQVASGHARYKLAAFGKPESPTRRKTQAPNPWAAVAAKR